MRIFKSYALRLTQILTLSLSIYLVLMAGTFYLQFQKVDAAIYLGLSLVVAILTIIMAKVIKQVDPELVVEVARLLYPSGGILSLTLGFLMGQLLVQNIESPGNQHWIPVFAGCGVLLFFLIRCFDIKFLRNESELPKSIH